MQRDYSKIKRSPKNNYIIRSWVNYDQIRVGYKKAKGERNCGNCDHGLTGKCKIQKDFGIHEPFNSQMICWKHADMLREMEENKPKVRPKIIIPMAQGTPIKEKEEVEQLNFLELLV